MTDAALANPEQDVVAEFHGIVMQQLDASATELFDSYGQPMSLSGEAEETKRKLNLALGAAIGFTGEHVRGVLAIAVDEDLAVKMNPLPTGSDPGASQDWIGELANQLLGRLKNKLLSVGVELALSTPVVVQGNDLRIGAVHRRATRLTFTNNQNEAAVWWDAEVDGDLVLSESDEEAQAEGDMLLF